MKFVAVTAVLGSFLFSSVGLATEEDLTVLRPSVDGVTPGQAFERRLIDEFNELVDQRSAGFEKALKSAKACRAWQDERRTFFLDSIGGLPERTPLDPQIVGELPGKGYRVQKIILETRPGFHLTANLYLPNTPSPWPAVLVPCGHSHEGKAVGQYQLFCRLLARHGMAALCYDPVGQGERYQMLDLSRKRTVFDDAPHVSTPHPHARLVCTTEHTMMGLGSALVGANVAQYRIWDGMRVIDYLQSRPDIIADKIGCTGNSGGGTETAYLMALDDRIVAAAPGCYLTTFRKLIETKGPQDGEQNIFGQIAFGLDQADFCIMRAPRPTLICAGTRDVTFNFDGTWDLFRDAKRFASRIGHADSVDIVAPDAPHGFTLQLREAVTRFMSRHLLNRDVVVREVESLPDSFTDDELRAFSTPDFSPEQLQCTPQGQVLLLAGEKSVFQLNSEMAAALKPQRTSVWNELDATAKAALIRRTVGAQDAAKSIGSEPQVATVGEVVRSNCVVHKLSLTAEQGLQLPALAFVPRQANGRSVLYLHDAGMKHDAAPGGPIDMLVDQGFVVLAAEVRGIGETETGFGHRAYGAGRFGRDLLEVLTAYLMGKSYVGMRTDDVMAWLRYLQSARLTTRAPTEIRLIAHGQVAIPALHAAALDRSAFTEIILYRMIPSWESIVAAGETFNQPVNIVHGCLKHYDLSDLIELVGVNKVKLLDRVDVMGNRIHDKVDN